MAFLDESGLAYLWNKIKTRYDGVVATFKGATSSTAGARGLVPAPAVGQQSNVLKGDGTWGTCDAVTLNGVAPSINGTHSYPFVPVVRTDGVMEVGKYIDFHDASEESNDYSTRVISYVTGLTINTDQTVSRLEFTNRKTSGHIQLEESGNFNFPISDLYCRAHRLIRDDEMSGDNYTSGWIRHPTGVIIAWGRITKSGSDSTYFTYPRGFGDVYGAWACIVAGGSSNYVNNGAFCKNVSTTGCNVYANTAEASEFRILIVGRE